MIFTIAWNDGEVENYEDKCDQVERIHQLEEQGFEMGVDFEISPVFPY